MPAPFPVTPPGIRSAPSMGQRTISEGPPGVKETAPPLRRPPILGYNYLTYTLAEAAVAPGGLSGIGNFPIACTSAAGASIFVVPAPIYVVGVFLSTSIENPNGVSTGVFVAVSHAGQTKITAQRAQGIIMAHVSRAPSTIGRATGFSVGDNNGYFVGSGQSINVYFAGNDGGVKIDYTLDITYILA